MKVQKEGPRYWIGLQPNEYRDERALGSFNVKAFKGRYSLEFMILYKDIANIIYVPAKGEVDAFTWFKLKDGIDVTTGTMGKAIESLVEHF